MSINVVVRHPYTEQQRKFVRLVAAGTDPTLAFRSAGYQDSDQSHGAARLLQLPHILIGIQVSVAERLAVGAPMALKVLQDFANDTAMHPKIRLDAAKTLLDRAGHVPPKAIAPGNAGETPLNEMSTAQLRELADKLENEIAGRAKEVSSAVPAPDDTQAIDSII